MTATRTPWPTSNPNDGPLWVQWWHDANHSLPHALMDGTGRAERLNDAQAATRAAQLGQPLPPRTETVEVPDGHHVEVVPDGLVSLWVTPEVRDVVARGDWRDGPVAAAARASLERSNSQGRDA